MKTETIIITRPRKENDPTIYTYQWGQKAVELATNIGYSVIDIQKDDTTYEKVSEAIKKYHPRVFVHWGHGCPSSLQGVKNCVITRKYDVNELICMADSSNPEERQRLLKLLNPLGQLSCPGICSLENDPCSPLCLYPTNVHLLKDTITYAVACHSSAQLGKCAIAHGATTYVGEDDLLMFPVDTIGSQDLFGDVQLSFIKELLLGKSVQEAERTMSELEDSYIRRFKKTKYVALPLLWNKIHRKILGDKNAMIYE